MGLFINNEQHPEVYKNTGIKNEQNQEILRKDFLAELLEIQQSTNLSLNDSLSELKHHNEKQKEFNTVQWNELNKQLTDFWRKDTEHYHLEVEMMERLKNLEEKNETIHSFMENEVLLKQEIKNEMQNQKNINQEMALRIEAYEALTQHLSKQIEKQQQNLSEKLVQQDNFHKEVLTKLGKQEMLNQQISRQIEDHTDLSKDFTEKLTQQEGYQKEILTKLDKQEASTEKLVRQVNHIRSILFERTNFLAEKIENGYKLTSTYLNKLITGSEQPLTFYTFKNKQENNQKKTE